MPKALFITGNKRSGTSQLVRLLNLHPEVFVSHESDAIWIISNFLRGQAFTNYPSDSALGMEYTLKTCGELLRKEKTPAENFFSVQLRLMETGSPWLPPEPQKTPLWVGDKKPFQYSDPFMTDFIRTNFSEPTFIHIVRHPFDVAESARRFNRTPNGDFWQGLTPEKMLEEWAKNETNVLGLKESGWAKVLDVRYEDLCTHTEKELSRIFNFLGLSTNAEILKQGAALTRYELKPTPQVSCSPQAQSIMQLYNYRPAQATKGKAQVFFTNLYWKLRKKIYA